MHLTLPPRIAGTFGNVVDCVIMCDPHTRKPRGFGFITYEAADAVERVCMNKFHELNGTRAAERRTLRLNPNVASTRNH